MIRSGGIFAARMRHPGSTKTLETIVIATFVALAVLLVGFWIWMVITARDERLDDTKIKVENLVRTMATHAQRSIEAADILLTDVVERVQHDGFNSSNLERLTQHLERQVGEVDTFAAFAAIDSAGTVRASSTPAMAPLKVDDRDYFRFHRGQVEQGLYIGKPITGRGTGRHIFPVTRVIRTPDGQFEGVAFGGMWADAFQKYYDTLDTGRLGVMRLALEDGTILIRKPYNAQNVGRNIIRDSQSSYLRERDAGALRTISPVDGIVRWTSIRTLPKFHLVVAASLSEAEELVSWRQETIQQSFIVLGILLLMSAFCTFLVSEIRYRHRMQISQEETVAQIRAITDNQPTLISYVDADVKIRFINKTGELWYGKPACDIVGMNITQAENCPPPLVERGSLLSRHPVRYEQLWRGIDGNQRSIEGLMVPDLDPDGEPRGYYIFATDVTERRLAEGQLRQAQKMEAVGQLTGGVAHDFNNLLTVILGNSEILASELPKDSHLRALADMTAAAAQRGADLTHRLLAFARRQMLAPKSIDVNELVAHMDGLIRRTLSEDIEIELVRGAGLWEALADPAELESALLNLCINARDAMTGGGRLTIETANTWLDQNYAEQHTEVRPGQYVMIAVSDTGTGISPEDIDRVFEPFFTTKETGKGTGLGLSMVYGFIKQSNGHVKIYSELGQGTTVKMYLPRADKSEAPATVVSQATPSAAGSERILVVEDDDLVRGHTESLLVSLGYKVVSASNAPEALAIIQKAPDFDLLFTDIIMPGGMNGRELAEAARKLKPTLKILFTSGYTENAIVHHGRLDRGVHLLNKPYRREDLAKKIRAILSEEK